MGFFEFELGMGVAVWQEGHIRKLFGLDYK